MRILQMVTRRQRRGAEVFASQLADALVDRGHEVFVLGLYAPSGDVLVPDLAMPYDLTCMAKSRLSFSRVRELRELLRRLQPDLVQANGSDTLKYSVMAKRGLPPAWPLVYRNISVASHWLHYPGQRMWGRWLMRQVDHVAAVSEESRLDFSRTYAVAPQRIETIPIGAEVPLHIDRGDVRRQLLAEISLPAGAELLLHIGSISPEKNHLWMLESFAEIRSARPEAHLLLIGEGLLRDAVRDRVRALHLEGAVHLLGTRAKAGRLTAGVDLLLLPSRIEGIPGVILEAAAHGTTCVATDVGGIREAVDPGRTGILVELDDRVAFVSAVIGLLGNPATRTKMGNAARDHVREHYEMGHIVDTFEDLYLRLASRHVRAAC